MSQAESPRLVQMREKLGRPSAKEEAILMEQFYPQIRQAILRGYSQTGLTLELFSRMREAERATRVNPSRPRLCADVLLTAPFSRYTSMALAANDMPRFKFTYDLNCGFSNAAYLTFLAEDELTGEDEAITRYTQDIQTFDPQGVFESPGDTYVLLKTDSKECAKLLRQDPSGLMVLEYGIESIRNEEPWRPLWQSRAYVIAGAELARDAYKILYEISERLNSPRGEI